MSADEQRITKVEQLENFPYKNFEEFQRAFRDHRCHVRVQPRIALDWVAGSSGKHMSNFQKVIFFILDFISIIAIIGFIVYDIVSGNWLWLFAVPILMFSLILGYPISALVYGHIRTIFFYSNIVGLIYAIQTNNNPLLVFTISILCIWFARRQKYLKAVLGLANAAVQHENILCALWRGNAVWLE